MANQIELDTMRSIQTNLAEIAAQLQLSNRISFLRLRIANGGFAEMEDFCELKRMLGISV